MCTPVADRQSWTEGGKSNRKRSRSGVDHTTDRRLHKHESDESKLTLKSGRLKFGIR